MTYLIAFAAIIAFGMGLYIFQGGAVAITNEIQTDSKALAVVLMVIGVLLFIFGAIILPILVHKAQTGS